MSLRAGFVVPLLIASFLLPLPAEGGLIEEIFEEWQGPSSISTGMTTFSYPLGMESLSSNPGWIGYIRRGGLVDFGPKGRIWSEQGHMAFSISPLGLELKWLGYGDGREGIGISLLGGGRGGDWGWGLRLKGAYIEEEKGGVGLTADLGFGTVQESGAFRGMGIVISNIFSPSIGGIKHETLRPSLLAGLCISPISKLSIMAGIELKGKVKEEERKGEIKGRAGMELDIPGPFKLRAGICDRGISGGLGVDLGIMKLDMAALLNPSLAFGGSFGLSLSSKPILPPLKPPKPIMEKRKRLNIGGYEEIDLKIRSTSDLLQISRSEEGKLIYDLDPDLRISHVGRRAKVELKQPKGARGMRVEIPEGTVLSSLDLEIPEGRSAEIDLRGLRVLNATIRTRARSTKILLGRRDPLDIAANTSLYVDARAGDISISGLGHAGFGNAKILVSGGDADLYISGNPEIGQKIEISIRSGKAKLSIPPDLGTCLGVKGFFGTIDIEGPFKRIGRHRYESTRYRVAPYKIDVDVNILFGSLKVESKK